MLQYSAVVRIRNQSLKLTYCRSIIISNNIQLLSKEMQPNFLPDDIKNIRKLSRQKVGIHYSIHIHIYI